MSVQAAVYLSRRWNRQPTQPVCIDWQHPLARNLVEYTLVTPSGLLTARDRLSAEYGATATTFSTGPMGNGRRHSAQSSASFCYAQTRSPRTGIGAYTIYCRSVINGGNGITPSAFATTRKAYGIQVGGPSSITGMAIGQGTGITFAGASNLGGLRSCAAITVTTGVAYDVFMSRPPPASVHTLEVLGVGTTTSSSDSNTLSAGIEDCGAVVGYDGSTSSPGDKTVFVGGWWERVLSAAERIALADNPWQLFKRDPQRLHFDLAVPKGRQTVVGFR